MKKRNFREWMLCAIVPCLILGSSELSAQSDKAKKDAATPVGDIEIPITIDTKKLLKEGQFVWKISEEELVKLANSGKDGYCIDLKPDPDLKLKSYDDMGRKLRKAFFKKELNTYTYKLKSETNDKIGNLVIRRSEGLQRSVTSLPMNNVRVVFDACNNDMSIITPDNKVRKGLYIKQREVLTFQIANINPLKYQYTLNQSLITLHADFEIDSTLVEADDTKDTEALVQGCFDKVSTLIDIYQQVSKKKQELMRNECIDRDLLYEDIKSYYKELDNAFDLSNTDSISRDITNHFRNQKCNDKAKVGEYFTFKKDENIISGIQPKMTELLKSLQSTLHVLVNALNTQSLTSLPVYIQGKNIDMVRYTVSKEAAEGSTSNAGEKMEVEYDIAIRGGFKIDVSAGLFLSGLTDEKYYLRDTAINDTTTYKKIIKDETSPLDLTIGSMVNLNYRLCNSFSTGLSFGAALPLTKEHLSPQVMGGLTFLFGREYRVGITGGVVYGPHEVLKGGYEVDNVYDITNNETPMTTKSDVSWFVGVVYNLGKTKLLGEK